MAGPTGFHIRNSLISLETGYKITTYRAKSATMCIITNKSIFSWVNCKVIIGFQCTYICDGVDGLLVRLFRGRVLQVEEGVLEELLEAQPLLGVRLQAAGEEVAAGLGQLPSSGDDDGLPLLDLDQHLEGGRGMDTLTSSSRYTCTMNP